MAIPILNHLDLRSVSELQNAILHTTTHTEATNKIGAFIYDTGSSTLKYCTGTSNSDWISLTGDTNTWRPVTVDTSGNGSANNTLETSETLMLKKGTNITLAEALGVVTISGLTAGISDGNVLTANDVVADNDFLRISGTEVEGLTVAEVLSELSVESGATADQTNAEIRTAVEAASDSNVFTDADHTKLNGIEALANVTDKTNVAAALALLDGDDTTYIGDAGDDTTVIIRGTLQVDGTTTTVDSTTVTLNDHNIVLDTGNGTSAVVDGAGWTLEGGSGSDVTWQWLASGTKMELKLGGAYANMKVGTIEGAFTGDVSGSSGSCTGNAATATALATARAINGTNFDGTAAITITAAGSTLSDTVPVGKGGTGQTTLTDGGILLGNGTSAVQAMSVLGDGEMIVGDGTTDPVAESGATLQASIGVSYASAEEVRDGTEAAKVVSPDTLAAKTVVSEIDVSDSDFISNLYAEIEHDFETADIVVECYNITTEQTIIADVERKDKGGTASTTKCTIKFSTPPSADVRVIITSGLGATAKTAVYA